MLKNFVIFQFNQFTKNESKLKTKKQEHQDIVRPERFKSTMSNNGQQNNNSETRISIQGNNGKILGNIMLQF